MRIIARHASYGDSGKSRSVYKNPHQVVDTNGKVDYIENVS